MFPYSILQNYSIFYCISCRVRIFFSFFKAFVRNSVVYESPVSCKCIILLYTSFKTELLIIFKPAGKSITSFFRLSRFCNRSIFINLNRNKTAFVCGIKTNRIVLCTPLCIKRKISCTAASNLSYGIAFKLFIVKPAKEPVMASYRFRKRYFSSFSCVPGR